MEGYCITGGGGLKVLGGCKVKLTITSIKSSNKGLKELILKKLTFIHIAFFFIIKNKRLEMEYKKVFIFTCIKKG